MGHPDSGEAKTSGHSSLEAMAQPKSPELNPVNVESSSFLGDSSPPPSSSSSFIEDIKHEIMVNHLFQQQCGRLWIGNGSGELEGVLLRKSRGEYFTCPPQLETSMLAYYCAQMNLQVCATRGAEVVYRC
jgi:hypothetical protein